MTPTLQHFSAFTERHLCGIILPKVKESEASRQEPFNSLSTAAFDRLAGAPIETLENSTLAWIRKALLAILIFGMIGSSAELLLIAHWEDPLQWAPLILLAAGFIALAFYGASRGPVSLRGVRWVMYGFIIAGFVGAYLHYRGSAEFKLESNPSLAGWALFWQAIRAKTPPLLAPGTMIELGLLGWVYTYKHPARNRTRVKGE